jgi:serine/threonine-protein phosphatase PGAM5
MKLMGWVLAAGLWALGAQASEARAATPAAAPGTRTIILVRHGEYDADPAADARLGPHLSALGVAQAHLVGARLAGMPGRIDGLHVSPLQRARDSAAVIAQDFPGRNFEVIDDLAECTPPARRAMDDPPEDMAACQAQLDRVFAAWFKAGQDGDRTDLFVCHGNVIRYLVTKALGVDSKAWLQMSIGHASITKIRIKPDGSMQVISVGDVGHLPPNLQSGTSADPERSLDVPAEAATAARR